MGAVAGLACMIAGWMLLIGLVMTTACALALAGVMVARGAARPRTRLSHSTRGGAQSHG